MTRSTSGSMFWINDEGVVGAVLLLRKSSSLPSVGASKAFLPVNISKHSVLSSQTKPPLQISILFPSEREFSKTLYRKHFSQRINVPNLLEMHRFTSSPLSITSASKWNLQARSPCRFQLEILG